MSIHGTKNGLADISTLDRMTKVMKLGAGLDYSIARIEDYGHQDCLLGMRAEQDVYRIIRDYLDKKEDPVFSPSGLFAVRTPWIGPIVGPQATACGTVHISAKCDPLLGSAIGAVIIELDQAHAGAGYGLHKGGAIHIASGIDPKQVLVTCDDDGWIRISYAIRSPDPAGVRLLMLLVYAQVDQLVPQPKYQAPVDVRPDEHDNKDTPIGSEHHDEETLCDYVERLCKSCPQDWSEGVSDHHMLQATSKPVMTFALASCQYPTGIFDEVPGEDAFRRLLETLDIVSPGTPEFLLLVGDQVYLDATGGLFDPSNRFDRFARPYEKLFRMPPLRALMRRLPVYMLLDDHEMVDNWEPPTQCGKPDTIMTEGRKAYLRQERSAGPDQPLPYLDSTDPMWYHFQRDGHYFFMADTRSERTWREATGINKTRMMSEGQFMKLKKWLINPEGSGVDAAHPRFIAEPSILFPRHLSVLRDDPVSAMQSDSWDGYPQSMHELLAHIADNRLENVVFLSGDEHLSCRATMRISWIPHGDSIERSVTVRSIHSSPLYAPFPFANSQKADLIAHERFEFSLNGVIYVCVVDTDFAPEGNGFAIVETRQIGRSWNISVHFHMQR